MSGASLDAVDVVQGKTSRVCPLQCEHGYKADGEACTKIACPAGQSVGDSNTCQKPKEKERSASRPPPQKPTPEAKPAPQKSGGDGVVVCSDRGGCQGYKSTTTDRSRIGKDCHEIETNRGSAPKFAIVCN